MKMSFWKVIDEINAYSISLEEKEAIRAAVIAGYSHGYGNIMAWLATAWAVTLRDEYGLSEEGAIDAVSNRGPYDLPE